MCTCRYVLSLPGFPRALEVPRVSFMVCLHDPECWGIPGYPEILGPCTGWARGTFVGVFLAVSLVPLSPVCVCAHIYTHLTHTLHPHTFTNIPHTFPLCHIGCSCLIRHHDHTHQLGRVQAHGYLHTVGSQPPQLKRSSCIT